MMGCQTSCLLEIKLGLKKSRSHDRVGRSNSKRLKRRLNAVGGSKEQSSKHNGVDKERAKLCA